MEHKHKGGKVTEEQMEQMETDLLNTDHRRWQNRPQGIGSGPGYRRTQRSQQSKARR